MKEFMTGWCQIGILDMRLVFIQEEDLLKNMRSVSCTNILPVELIQVIVVASQRETSKITHLNRYVSLVGPYFKLSIGVN